MTQANGTVTTDRAQKFFEFASQKRATVFVYYAVTASGNVDMRSEDIRRSISRSQGIWQELQRTAAAPGGQRGQLIGLAKEFHYELLDVIWKLCVLAEAFFTSLHVVKKNYKRLPLRVLDRISPWTEMRWAKRAPHKEIRRLFLLPNSTEIFKNADRRRVLRKATSNLVREVGASLRGLALFYERYAQVYNKYKHTVSEHTGYVELVDSQEGKRAKTILFFEDYPPSRKRNSRRRRPYTWGIIAGDEVLAYLGDVLRNTVRLHKGLLVCRLEYLHNQGRPFFPSLADFLNPNDLEALRSAVREEPTFRAIGQINMLGNIKWDPNKRSRAEDVARRKSWVFKLSGHVFRGRKGWSTAKVQAQMAGDQTTGG